MKKLANIGLAGICAIIVGSGCNAAPDGYNAPFGASVEVDPTSMSLNFTSGATGGESASQVVSVFVQVPRTIPAQQNGDVTDPGSEDFNLIPGNNIFVRVVCQGAASVQGSSDGSFEGLDPISEDTTNTQSDGQVYFGTTDGRGVLTVAIVASAPGAPGGTYSTTCTFDVGVASVSVDITASQNAE